MEQILLCTKRFYPAVKGAGRHVKTLLCLNCGDLSGAPEGTDSPEIFLVGIDLRAAFETSFLFCNQHAFLGALTDAVALKLGQSAENRQHKLPLRRGGVDGFFKAHKCDALSWQLVYDEQQIPCVARDPRDVRANHRVTLPRKGEHSCELGAVFVFAGSLVNENLISLVQLGVFELACLILFGC